MFQSCFEVRKRSLNLEGEKQIVMLGELPIATISIFL